MLPRARQLTRIIRTGLVALLLAGLAIQPVLVAAGQLHELEHAITAREAADHAHADGHTRLHSHDHKPHHDPAHATGSHSLMHHHAVTSAAVVPPSMRICATTVAGKPDFPVPELPAIRGRYTVQLRPPIA